MIYLYLWMVVATDRTYTHMGWVNAGSFDHPISCSNAARSLGVDLSKVRCISSTTGGNVLK